MNSRWVARASPRPAWQSGDRRRGPRRAFGFTLYSTLCVVSRAPRVRRERWLQVLDGMRRQRGIRTCSTRRPRRPQFRRGGFCDVGGKQSRGIIASRESGLSAAPKSSRRPRFERRRLRGTAVATPSPLARGGGVRPPADCEAGERWRHVWCARQIAYLSLPFCALMRALTRAAASLLLDAAEAEPAACAEDFAEFGPVAV